MKLAPYNSGLIQSTQMHRPIWLSGVKSAASGVYLITSKVLDARRRGATTEAYGAIRRRGPTPRKEERSKATPSFDFAQGREPVERQMMPCWWIRGVWKTLTF